MSAPVALLVGVGLGVLIMSWILLGVTVRYVSSDIDGFRRWLDIADAPGGLS